MNAENLSRAIAHWLEWERLCGRADLFSEAALRQPIGQFLKASQGHKVVPEHSAPWDTATKPKAFDFCLKRRGGTAITDVIETKWAGTSVRATLSDEVFRDLYRLTHVCWVGQAEPCQRWFILAGISKAIEEEVFDKEANPGDGARRIKVLKGILGKSPGDKCHHHIYTASTTAPKPILERWCAVARDLGPNRGATDYGPIVMSSIQTMLKGKFPNDPSPTDCVCYVWRVTAPTGYGFKKIQEVLDRAT